MGQCDSTLEDNLRDISHTYTKVSMKKIKINNYLGLSKYRISPINLGRGLTSVVSIGMDSKGKKYAIKQIKKYSREFRQNEVMNEAQISLKLNHPNIIKTYEVFEDESSVNFVMDICQDGDLNDYLNKKRHFSSAEIMYIFIQILEAINYLHNVAHVCHRDIKLENFMITFDHTHKPLVKLIDFGFSTYLNKGQKMYEQLGTPEYYSPELITKKGYDEKVDIWGSGIILFILATGVEPFKNNSGIILNEQILKKNIKFNLIKDQNIRRLCQKLLERDNEKRPNAQEALQLARNVKNLTETN